MRPSTSAPPSVAPRAVQERKPELPATEVQVSGPSSDSAADRIATGTEPEADGGGAANGTADGSASAGATYGGGSGTIAAAQPGDLVPIRQRIQQVLVYPPRARKARWEGRVLLSFVLRMNGSVDQLAVALSSGIALLDEAAISAVKRGTPFPRPGCDVRIEIPVVFQLR